MSKPREPGMMTVPIDSPQEPDWAELEAFTASLPDSASEFGPMAGVADSRIV